MINERYPFKKSWRWTLIKCFDFFIDPFAGWIRRRKFPTSVQNILVIRLDQIGDLVCTLPVFPILKRRFPQAKITVLTGSEGKAILDQNPFVDRLITFRSNWFLRNRITNPIEFFQVLSDLRKTHYNLGFDLRGDLRNIILMALAGVRYRIGYGIAGGGGLLHETRPYDAALHQVELNARLVTDGPVSKLDLKPEIYFTPKEKENALNRLKGFGIPPETRLIAVHPEAGYSSKEWEEEKFKKLIAKFLEDSQNRVLIVGLSKAQGLAASFSDTNRVISLVGALSLREMIAVLSQCHLLVGNDSGPSHLAQAFGIPVVV
ncbi:MAG: hypothetical protein A2629_02415, partial [Candidatus Levybacteria bacterium RIFCSPHIGHO2_01_FULL_41_15]